MSNRITILSIVLMSAALCFAQEDDNVFRKKSKKTENSTAFQRGNSKYRNAFDYDELTEPIEQSYSTDEWRNDYISLGFINSKMSQNAMSDLKSNYGISFNVGRTFYLHRPIGEMLRFGIDATWCDLNYTNYKIKHITYWKTDNYQYHQGEISMHIGPSVTVMPVENLNIHGYFRYAPSFSILYADDTFYGNYATFFVGGVSISYDVIGLGIESRFGNCKYKEFGSDSDEQNLFMNKTKHNGWKVYLIFRF